MLYTKLRDWIRLISLIYENTIAPSRIYEEIDDRETHESEKIYNNYLDERGERMKNTQFQVEGVFYFRKR